MYNNFSDDTKNNFQEEDVKQSVEEKTIEPSQDILEEKQLEISTLEKEIATLKEQMLRALADAENSRKRNIKEKEEVSKYAIGDFSRSLLGVADNLRRALESSDTVSNEKAENVQIQSIIAGIEMTEKELNIVFEKYGIRKITPKGEQFDPHAHQAVMEVESAQASGTVVDVLQAGYLIHDRVLRPAMVSVAKKK